MANIVTVHNAALMRKIASFSEVKKLIQNIGRDMAIKAAGELKDHELNFGNPSQIGSVAVDIGRRSGNLARSFSFKKISESEWAVMQTQSIAPYAGDVAVYSMRRFGMTYIDSVRRRLFPYLYKGAKDEFELAINEINSGRIYKYHPLYGE